MLNIARIQIMEGLLDTKYILLAILIILAFISNGITFSEKYKYELEDFNAHVAENNRLLQENTNSLQSVAVFNQQMLKPPSPLSFISESGEDMMPNVVVLNAFSRYDMEYQHRNNEMIPIISSLDWTFIVGIFFSLLAILLSYDAVAGEKKQGTLKLVLSNSISRVSLYVGKFLGLLFVTLILFIFGVLINILTISILDGPRITIDTLWPLCWAFFLSTLYISSFIFTGLAVSSLNHKPAISLVVLLVIWVITVFVVPGVGRLIAERMIDIPTQAEVQAEAERVADELWESRHPLAANWGGDPFQEHIPFRAEFINKTNEAVRKVRDSYIEEQLNQIAFSRNLISLSPYGLLSDGMQVVSCTGFIGVNQLYHASKDYRKSLHQYVVNMDKKDPDTPHQVYGYDNYVDPGVFSQKPVDFESIPSMKSYWTESGMSKNSSIPFIHLILLVSFNLFSALIAFLALTYYDPR